MNDVRSEKRIWRATITLDPNNPRDQALYRVLQRGIPGTKFDSDGTRCVLVSLDVSPDGAEVKVVYLFVSTLPHAGSSWFTIEEDEGDRRLIVKITNGHTERLQPEELAAFRVLQPELAAA